ncbi:MAG: M48 family metallopeptidase [Limisphaerales bacterium]
MLPASAFDLPRSSSSLSDTLSVAGRPVPLRLVRHLRARRYLLRVRPDGSVRVTIPRGGSLAEARLFAERNTAWIEDQLRQLPREPARPRGWFAGDSILFRGEAVKIESTPEGAVWLADATLGNHEPGADLRPVVERYLWRLASRELPLRVSELADRHSLMVRRISVRNQRSRWGSCSRRATLSLNWRLIQTPPFVRDYIVLHELMHLRQMNHSPRFWAEVERVCPGWREAEHWLKQHSSLLR